MGREGREGRGGGCLALENVRPRQYTTCPQTVGATDGVLIGGAVQLVEAHGRSPGKHGRKHCSRTARCKPVR